MLESLANDLDFRKYEAQLFELLILGHLLAPGGNLLVEGDECPISVLGTDVTEIREVVGVFERLIRRYAWQNMLIRFTICLVDDWLILNLVADTNIFRGRLKPARSL